MSLRTIFIIALVLGAVWVFYRRTTVAGSASSPAEPGIGGGADCALAAQRASDELGNGIGRFINPPLDAAAWDAFRSGVESRISAAESQCRCPADACDAGRQALASMRDLLGQLDRSARSGEPFSSNIVQQQSEIDGSINRARDLSSGR